MTIIAGILVLSVSIVVHEMGHLLMGKWVGIKARVFSFGYGKGIWKKEVGDTTYQITAIPLGGYVQFYGDDIHQIGQTKPGDFFHAGPWRRMIPVFGGPLFNLLLGVVILAAFNFVGMDKPTNRVSVKSQLQYTDKLTGQDMKVSSPAYQAGMRHGDRIVAINGEPINTYSDIKKEVALSGPKQKLKVEYVREGKRFSVDIKPVVLHEGGYSLIGVSPFYEFAVQGVVEGGPFARAGIQKNDVILEVNGKRPAIQEQISQAIQQSHSGQVSLTLLREEKKITKEVNLVQRSSLVFDHIVHKPTGYEFTLERELLDYNKWQKNFAQGRVLVEGQKVTSAQELIRRFRELVSADKEISLKHGGSSYLVRPRVKELFYAGFSYRPVSVESKKVEYGFLASIGHGFLDAFEFVALNIKGIGKLFSGDLSVQQNLSGPVRIAKIAGDVAEHGIGPLLLFLAHISVILMVMNLLPIPVVDGGHIIFFLIEGLRGKPIDPKIQEKIMAFFVVLLIGLGIFVLLNDILSLDSIKNLIKSFG